MNVVKDFTHFFDNDIIEIQHINDTIASINYPNDKKYHFFKPKERSEKKMEI